LIEKIVGGTKIEYFIKKGGKNKVAKVIKAKENMKTE
jgi:hypothetical protein